jgi:hypothetical protein
MSEYGALCAFELPFSKFGGDISTFIAPLVHPKVFYGVGGCDVELI